MQTPYYDPQKSYEENFKEGPFGTFADGQVFTNQGKAVFDFLGQKIYSLFGIPAGPLVNGKFIKAGFDKGFDICTYKTVRSGKCPCHPWPNVAPLDLKEDLTLKQAEEGVKVKKEYEEPLSITNSFGVPSFDPDFWQKDMADSVSCVKEGQVVIGSFQGTPRGDGNRQTYIKDFASAAKLVKETGARILEVNLSCPNEGTNNLLCFDVETAREVVEIIKNKIGNTPLIIKIAYFADDHQLMNLVESVGKIVEGIQAINTIPAKILNEAGGQFFKEKDRQKSGVCGAGVKWAGLNMVKRLKSLREELGLSFVIMGTGGVMDVKDFQEYKETGADVIMSATGSMWDPYLAQKVKEALK